MRGPQGGGGRAVPGPGSEGSAARASHLVGVQGVKSFSLRLGKGGKEDGALHPPNLTQFIELLSILVLLHIFGRLLRETVPC